MTTLMHQYDVNPLHALLQHKECFRVNPILLVSLLAICVPKP